MIFPPAVRPGQRVRVVAPSGPFDRDLFRLGIEYLSQRYRVEHDPGIFQRSGFLAGSDARRLDELNTALRDPTCRAVVVARGGHGLLRIVHSADFAALRANPKWLVGFSDATLLHIEASRVGVASIHAHNLTGLGRSDETERQSFVRQLEAPGAARLFTGLGAWHGGSAQGPLFGGNLTLLLMSAASGRLQIPEGAVLFLEDIHEAPYRIDRMLSALLVSGALDRVAAVVMGDLTECAPGIDGTPAHAVLEERLGGLGIPVLFGLPAGHEARNTPLTLGLAAHVDAAKGTLSITRTQIA